MDTKPPTNAHLQNCPVEAVTEVIGGKWKPVIVFQLLQSTTLRFGELQRRMPGITQKMLTKQLRELEAKGIIQRTVYPEVPPKVEYSLTETGMSLNHIISHMKSWGEAYVFDAPVA